MSFQASTKILRAFIRPEYGLDYKIVSTDEGFEISVFVLTKQSCGWGGETLPGNPDTVKIYASRTTDSVKTEVEKTSARRYGTIRILGSRIVVCTSFYNMLSLFRMDMLGAWNPQEEIAYLTGTGDLHDAPYLQDEARRQERLYDVYRKFVVNPAWYYNNQIWRSPQWDGQGSPLPDNGPMQKVSRSTLSWLPLETGVDYSVKPYLDGNGSNAHRALRQPQVWLYNEGEDKLVPANNEQIGLSVLPDALGIFLHANPNHILAKRNFSGPSDYIPLWDWQNMIATLAYMTDQRMYCEQKIEGASPSDGVLEIDASDCQFWWLAPGTLLDVDNNGQAVLSPPAGEGGSDGMIVRNDWARMAARMAGALARHYQERARAQIIIRGLLPWGGLLGQILTVIDEGGSAQTIEAPITGVRWLGGDQPSTIISTGFAEE